MTRNLLRSMTKLVVPILLCFACTAWAEEQSSAEFLTPPVLLQAASVLPKELLAGSNYKIDTTIANDGFVNTYVLATDYGPTEVESTALLMMRLNELKALEHMGKLEQSEAFKDALRIAVKGPLKTAKGIVTQPQETITGIGTGIGRWFGDVRRSIKSDDPYQENVLKTALGYASVKRMLAFEYGIDPYTRYEPVQKKLSEVGRAMFAGGLTVKAAFMPIQGPAGMVVRLSSTSNSMRQLVRDKSPAELEDINQEKLDEMGVSPSVAKAFLKNPYYSPQEKILLVGELYSMRAVEGRGKFIAASAQVYEPSVALFMRLRAQMMANYNANVAFAKRIVEVNGVPFLQREDGVIVGLFPLDHVAWTEGLLRKESAGSESLKKVLGVTGKELWIEGTVSSSARKALESRGWKVEERVESKLTKESS